MHMPYSPMRKTHGVAQTVESHDRRRTACISGYSWHSMVACKGLDLVQMAQMYGRAIDRSERILAHEH